MNTITTILSILVATGMFTIIWALYDTRKESSDTPTLLDVERKAKIYCLSREEAVICNGCNCYVEERSAKKIPTETFGHNFVQRYCKKCAPPYDRVELSLVGHTKYYKQVEVDHSGKILDKKS